MVMLNIASLRPAEGEEGDNEEHVDADEVMRLRDINVWYGDNHAIKDVSLEIPPRKVTALIGPSGCGKSTLLRTLNRMNDEIPGCRTTGSVQWRGVDILDADVDP
ncbi:MAG: ATP-binding cassette domain-containing protein, partial [Thermoplasmata archaeon]|nr:ATP-binding cassette domain-containing protein [Thermoplasmata archaeon]NIS13255.1 ATP-binding cassette domain-containing protein [Thermoplasmata archaeon]NIS21150.1 ATP-binding cassette domain-containing protein [Thermoplasmata archaeon]NIT78637.1 ATP-binding cassette domain-containing protein [Thermoplasmata archaeon]NIU50205.1 ATP-binding cassette domain-containing protein [Thermoplasmata archaeon]